MASRKCKQSSDRFCYVCGQFIFSKKRRPIVDSLKTAYLHYFGFPVANQDKKWVPHMFCESCRIILLQWSSGEKVYLPFGSPMLWREPSNHENDCYFCVTKTLGYNKKNKASIMYADVPSVTKPILHSKDLPHPVCPGSSSANILDDNNSDVEFKSISSDSDEFSPQENTPHLINQAELNDLIRDLQLSRSKAELLGSRLQQWNLLLPDTKVTFFRNRSKVYSEFFKREGEYCYCTDIPGLFEAMNQNYDKTEWRLFIDSSKYSLKAVLLHNGNKKPSIPIGHAVNCKESYETMRTLINLIKYKEHQWKVCGDLKVIGMLVGLQGGYTKYCCFLCLWDSRAKQHHYVRKEWPVRNEYIPGKMNINHELLVDPNNVTLPPLHIKLGLMKNFVKALDKNSDAFRYLQKIFPNITEGKLKEGIFIGPQIRKIMKDSQFENLLSVKEKSAWNSFKMLVENFLGNKKSENYEEIVNNLLKNFHDMGVNMSLKIHFLHSHLNFFPENLGSMSDEQGERFHQDLRTFEERHQGFWDENMLGDYCWSIIRETDSNNYKKKAKISHF